MLSEVVWIGPVLVNEKIPFLSVALNVLYVLKNPSPPRISSDPEKESLYASSSLRSSAQTFLIAREKKISF